MCRLVRKVVSKTNYYISDLHLNCTNKYEGRTLEHDKLIKENWNRVVTNADTVYILGDIGREGGNKEMEYLCDISELPTGIYIIQLSGYQAIQGSSLIRKK